MKCIWRETWILFPTLNNIHFLRVFGYTHDTFQLITNISSNITNAIGSGMPPTPPTLANFFFYQGFLSQTQTIHRTAGGREGTIFYSTLPLPTAHKHRDIYLHVRWLSRIFNRNACAYQTATRWDLPPYRITIWLIDWLMMQCCLFTWWIDSRILLQRFWHGKPVDLSSHRLSLLYYKRTD